MGPIVTEETYQKMPTKEAAEKAHWICRQIKVLTKEAIGELEFETEMFEGMSESAAYAQDHLARNCCAKFHTSVRDPSLRFSCFIARCHQQYISGLLHAPQAFGLTPRLSRSSRYLKLL